MCFVVKAGIGKTTFIKNVLKDKNFDMVYYDSSDIRNKYIRCYYNR